MPSKVSSVIFILLEVLVWHLSTDTTAVLLLITFTPPMLVKSVLLLVLLETMVMLMKESLDTSKLLPIDVEMVVYKELSNAKTETLFLAMDVTLAAK